MDDKVDTIKILKAVNILIKFSKQENSPESLKEIYDALDCVPRKEIEGLRDAINNMPTHYHALGDIRGSGSKYDLIYKPAVMAKIKKL